MTQCNSCRFYDRNNVRVADGRAVQWGLCRRQPPHLNAVNAKAHAIEGVWPTVRDDDWCGEWQAQRRREADHAPAVALAQPPAAAASARSAGMAGDAASLAAGYKPAAAKCGG